MYLENYFPEDFNIFYSENFLIIKVRLFNDTNLCKLKRYINKQFKSYANERNTLTNHSEVSGEKEHRTWYIINFYITYFKRRNITIDIKFYIFTLVLH